MSINEIHKGVNTIHSLMESAVNKNGKIGNKPNHGSPQRRCLGVQVDCSKLPVAFSKAAEVIAKTRAERDERIAEIKAEIRDGFCMVDATKVAEKIIQDLLVNLVAA